MRIILLSSPIAYSRSSSLYCVVVVVVMVVTVVLSVGFVIRSAKESYRCTSIRYGVTVVVMQTPDCPIAPVAINERVAQGWMSARHR
jgi:methenyltetrahydromethanopterin cyclohydrolase